MKIEKKKKYIQNETDLSRVRKRLTKDEIMCEEEID